VSFSLIALSVGNASMSLFYYYIQWSVSYYIITHYDKYHCM